MKKQYTSNRLLLNSVTQQDLDFVFELVNMPEWLRFIGNRHVDTKDETCYYIKKIIDNPNIHYWVVTLKEEQIPVGIVTFIKRYYLEHFDIGFAFLKRHTQKGYAYEAANTILQAALADPAYNRVVATTLQDNVNSIQLLGKLNFQFEKKIRENEEELLLYFIEPDRITIDKLTKSFFGIFYTKEEHKPDWKLLDSLCLQEIRIIKKTGLRQEVYDLPHFIEPRKKILSDGTLTEFEEYEISHETKIVGNIAQRYSVFQKRGYLKGEAFKGTGHKFFQFIKTEKGWKISAVIWEDEE